MKFANICISLLGVFTSSSATVRHNGSRRAAVADYLLTWEGCDKALGDISAAENSNIFCNYIITPNDDVYQAQLFGWSGVEGEECAGSPPPMVDFTGGTFGGTTVDPTNPYTATANDDPQLTNQFHPTLGAGEFYTDIDIDRNQFQNGGQEETFHFCIRHDVMEDLDNDGTSETSLYFMKTFITVRFFLDGTFELNADSEGKIGDDDEVYTGDDDVLFPGNDNILGNDDGTTEFNDNLFGDDDPSNGGGVNVTENTTASEVFDDFNKTYSVFAYQCEVESPHDQTDRIIYQGDNLGICVETLFRDTLINEVKELELVQDNNAGGLYSTKPVTGSVDNVVTESSCDFDSRIGEPQSKCFIKTAMLSQFYITQLVVNATGEVDLLIRTTATNPSSSGNVRRLEERRSLQGLDGSYVVSTVVGVRDGVEANSDTEVSGSFNSAVGYCLMISTLLLNFV